MEKDAVEIFESKIVQRAFLWGVKDKALKGFVENFSCILRDECIAYGMFNERVDCYGGQTQSIRARFERNGFMFECINEAKASSLGSSHKMNKRQDIIQAKFILQEFYDQ